MFFSQTFNRICFYLFSSLIKINYFRVVFCSLLQRFCLFSHKTIHIINMKWTVHLEGGPRRVNHAAVCVGDKIYSFGGYCSTEDYSDWSSIPVHVLDTNTLRWSSISYKKNAYIPFQRYGHTTIAYGHKVYMWGGRNNAIGCDTLSCFDTKTLEWSVPAVTGMVPYAKDGHSACVIKNKMYIFGGFEYITEQYSQEVHSLNLDTMEWEYIPVTGSIPSHRDFHTAVGVDNRMYIFGGRGDLNSPYNSQEEVYCPDVYYLDLATEKWVCIIAKGIWPEGRRSHSAWYYKGYMYIFGGFNGNTKRHFNDLYRFSIKDHKWEFIHATGDGPCERRRQVCLNHKDKVYLFGGTSPCPHSDNTSLENMDDNSDLHVLDYSPTLKTLSILKVLEYKLDQTQLPRDVLLDIWIMTHSELLRPQVLYEDCFVGKDNLLSMMLL